MSLEILDWPEGFVLEQATRVAPADWPRYADRPPATLPLGSTAEFFRLAEVP